MIEIQILRKIVEERIKIKLSDNNLKSTKTRLKVKNIASRGQQSTH